MVGGFVQGLVGLTVAVATFNPVAFGAYLHGADVAGAGLEQLITGRVVQSNTEQAVTATAQALGASEQTASAIGSGVDMALSIGLSAGTSMVSRGAGTVAGGTTTTTSGQQTVYRVFGGDSRAQGFSWTPENPMSVSNFRNQAGLPAGNSGNFMIKGTVNPKNIIQSRPALPLDGNQGGLREFIINPQNVNITDFRILNP